MPDAEQIDGRRVLPLVERDFQLAQAVRDAHPEIIADEQHRLHMPAIALPQRPHQRRLGPLAPGVQPLLELVEEKDDLALPRPPAPQQR